MGVDEMSVLDPLTMKVHGLEGLRVVDASSMPYVTNGNIYAPVMMLAEKSADLILGNTPSSRRKSTSPPPPAEMSLPPAAVAGYRHVSLTVTDLARSTRWYEQVLGVRKVADRSGEGWVRSVMRSDGEVDGRTHRTRARAGGRKVRSSPRGSRPFRSRARMATVRDWIDHLDALGVTHGPLEEPGYATVVTAATPTGSRSSFSHRLPEAEPVQATPAF